MHNLPNGLPGYVSNFEKMLMNLICLTCSEITLLKLLPLPPGVNGLIIGA